MTLAPAQINISSSLKTSMALSEKNNESRMTSMNQSSQHVSLVENKENANNVTKEDYQKLIDINLALQKKVSYLSNRNDQLMGIITSYEEKIKALAMAETTDESLSHKYPASAPRTLSGTHHADIRTTEFNYQDNKDSISSANTYASQKSMNSSERTFENFEIELILRNLDEDNIRGMEIDELRRSTCTLKSLVEHMIRKDGISNRVIDFYKKMTADSTSTLSDQNKITVRVMEQYIINLLAENEKMSKALDALNKKVEKLSSRKNSEEQEKSLASLMPVQGSGPLKKKKNWFSLKNIFCEY